TGEDLVIRADDTEATVRKRLGIYHEQTKPLVGFYQKAAADGKTKYHHIDGTQQVEAIAEQLSKLLG
ncbi:MAG: adenylate kinase, partial [Alkalimonas sp.]|nr:adenylate kinase [Alkalimonas sp.]